MKKQTILTGFITAAFILVATGASFAGDQRLHRPGGNHWKGKHFAAQKHRGQWKSGHQVRHPQAHWKGRPHVPQQRWNSRGFHQRPGYRAHQNPYRRGWGAPPPSHHRPGRYGHRPEMRRNNDRHPAGASFGRQHEGRGNSRGDAGDRADMRRGDRQGGRGHDTAVASDDTQSRRGNRDASRRQ
jgi:hypothetical protein